MKLGSITIRGGEVHTVVEVGQCPGNSPEEFLRHAQAAKDAGCSFVKGQVLLPELIAAEDSPPYWDTVHESQREAFRKFGVMDEYLWGDVKAGCEDIEIEWVATPFHLSAVETLARLEPAFIKIASGDITYKDLIVEASRTHIPLVLSTGASTVDEVRRAIHWVGGKSPVLLMACTLSYPAKNANLYRIQQLKETFWDKYVGYSDHTLGTETAFGAAVMGAVLLEKHFTLSREVDADDGAMALLPDEMATYVRMGQLGVKFRGKGMGVDDEEIAAHGGARRSLFAAEDIEEGDCIRREGVVALRPRHQEGIGAAEIDAVVGTRAKRAYQEGELIG